MILSEEGGCEHSLRSYRFGEESVNYSVDLLSRVLVAFSFGQISAFVAVILRE